MRLILIFFATLVLSATTDAAEHRFSIAVREHGQLDRVVRHVEQNHPALKRHLIRRLGAASFVVDNPRIVDAVRNDPRISHLLRFASPVGRCSIPAGEVPYDFASESGAKAAFPNDPDFGKQWPISCISADRAWDLITGGDVKIAIIDTGVDFFHPDLRENLNTVDDWDFVNDDDYPLDDNGHGTHVSGIAAAVIDNGVGIAGCFQAEIIGIKVLDAGGSGWYDDVAAGISYAAEKGVASMNLSLGGSTSDPLLEAACDDAYAAGSLVVAASGNGGPLSTPSYPAHYRSVMGVGALGGFFFGDCNKLAFFSTRGFGDDQQAGNVEVVAPGKFIYSSWLGGDYSRLDGTSMAAPHAAALAAGYKAYLPAWSAEQIRHHIQASADDMGNENKFGYGRIDFYPPVD